MARESLVGQLVFEINIDIQNMLHWVESVKSGDPDNYEARAAAYYWKNIFKDLDFTFDPLTGEFRREREGEAPNNFLNYGYALLRAVIARSLVGSGLLPTFGIHHRNRYNPYCLADDIMEPYRPFVDKIVLNIVNFNGNFLELTPNMKKELLNIPALDVKINEEKSPLMVAVQKTTASLVKCFEGKQRKIVYPEFV